VAPLEMWHRPARQRLDLTLRNQGEGKMTMRASTGCIGALLAIAFVSAAPARATEPKVPADPPHVEDVLRATSQYLAKQKAFSYHAEVEFDQLLPGGPKVRLSGAVDVAVTRPGRSSSIIVTTSRTVSSGSRTAASRSSIRSPGPMRSYPGRRTSTAWSPSWRRVRHGASPGGSRRATRMRCSPAASTSPTTSACTTSRRLLPPRRAPAQDLDLQIFVELGDKPLPRKSFRVSGRAGFAAVHGIHHGVESQGAEIGLFAAKVPKEAAKVDFLPIREGR
jgi:hypothetical protein